MVHESWAECVAALAGRRIFAATTRGATRPDQAAFHPDDVLLFGPETRGLPTDVLAGIPPERCLRLPMRPDNRSMNLSNAVAVTVFEAWRQHGFAGGV